MEALKPRQTRHLVRKYRIKHIYILYCCNQKAIFLSFSLKIPTNVTINQSSMNKMNNNNDNNNNNDESIV